MIDFIIQTLIWCMALYGMICLIESLYQNYTYSKIKSNVKLILVVKNAEEGIENYVKELKYGKNFYNNLVIIDMNSEDKTVEILKELEKETINMKILNEKEGKEYLEHLTI